MLEFAEMSYRLMAALTDDVRCIAFYAGSIQAWRRLPVVDLWITRVRGNGDGRRRFNASGVRQSGLALHCSECVAVRWQIRGDGRCSTRGFNIPSVTFAGKAGRQGLPAISTIVIPTSRIDRGGSYRAVRPFPDVRYGIGRPDLNGQVLASDDDNARIVDGQGKGGHAASPERPRLSASNLSAVRGSGWWMVTRVSLSIDTASSRAPCINAGQYRTGIDPRRRISDAAECFTPMILATAPVPPRVVNMSSTVLMRDRSTLFMSICQHDLC
jgi:hypothetical protein